MTQAESKGAPSLAGWAIAVAAGVVVAGVTSVVMDFGIYQALFAGLVVCGVVGLILGFPRSDEPAAPVTPVVKAASAASTVAPVATPAAPTVAAPAAAMPAEAPPATAGARPAALAAPRAGGPDDLKRIKGIGPKLEELCHSLGFYHFDQIAAWTPAEVAWVDENLEGFKGRVTRDDWVAQAKVLAAGGETEFSAGRGEG
ncbi:MAG: NADH:ubiquinone oxidoreductase [Gemmobacter sp.]